MRKPDYVEWVFRLFAAGIVLLGLLPLLVVTLLALVITAGGWAIIGAGSGLIFGTRNLVRMARVTHQQATRSRKRPKRAPRLAFFSRIYQQQPASYLYMVDGGWIVLESIVRHTRKLNRRRARQWRSMARERRRRATRKRRNLWDYPVSLERTAAAIGMRIGHLLHYAAAVGLVAVFAPLFTLFLVGGALVTGLLMVVIGLFNRAYSAANRMAYRCPNCHEQMVLPVYICPTCDRQHTRLWPSVYGVFHHTCLCGTRLPTLDALGRRDMVQRCPHCDHVLNEAIGRARNVHIPIVGGPSAGKTHYLIAALQAMMEGYGPARGWQVTMPDVQDQRAYKTSVERLNRGLQLGKTAVERDSHTRAYNLQLRKGRQRVPTLLYIYDGAGEYYTRQESALQQTYYRYMNGVILIVDPFTIERVNARYRDALAAAGDGLAVNSGERLSGIYERMLETLEIHYNLQPGVRFPHPVAVVLTKVDAFDLEQRIGQPAARREMKRRPELTSEGDAIHTLVQRFLLRNGEDNFVRNLHAQFSAVRFFSSSSTGRMVIPGDQRRFQPVRVLDPLLWLLSTNHALPGQQRGLPLSRPSAPQPTPDAVPTP